ncbi:MAG: TlpA family protein disulfide reductase [Xanthomonadales bacterium]|nr:TlpA family protein disulfide reductase [Xanthomonadales bacterium]
MMKIIKQWRKDKYNVLLMDVILVMLVLVSFSWWQNKDSLSAEGQIAPDFTLTALDQSVYQLSRYRGREVLVYFFAPWCSICRLSADNLNNLRAVRSDDNLMIMMVALSYEHVDEVRTFVDDLNLQVPVLLGTKQQLTDYQIIGFPTYYVIDSQGKLQSKSIGYSTELGMRVRTW